MNDQTETELLVFLRVRYAAAMEGKSEALQSEAPIRLAYAQAVLDMIYVITRMLNNEPKVTEKTTMDTKIKGYA